MAAQSKLNIILHYVLLGSSEQCGLDIQASLRVVVVCVCVCVHVYVVDHMMHMRSVLKDC